MKNVKKYWIPVLGLLLAAGILFLCMTPSKTGEELNLRFFSIGKADAILLSSKSGTVLIDTGEKNAADTILAYLKEKEISEIDVLILTHFDKDHVGGAAKILKHVNVKTILQSNCPKDRTEYDRYLAEISVLDLEPVTVTDTYSFTLGKAQFTVKGTGGKVYEVNESNNSSLITEVTFGENRMLFLGDAQQERLQDYFNSGIGTFSLVKLPHHGEYISILKPLLNHCGCTQAVVTCSAAEPADKKTIQLLSDLSMELFSTQNAPVDFRCDGTKIEPAA